MRSVLVTSAQKDTSGAISSCLGKAYRIESAKTKDEALNLLQKNLYDFIFIDLDILLANISNDNYMEALQQFWNQYPSIEIIVMADQRDLRKVVMAVKAGARNYLTYPIDAEEVRHVSEVINETVIMESELDYLRDKFWHVDSLELIQTRNNLMQDVFAKIRSVSPTKSTVLLLGETGTGKSMMAKLIHQHSNRRDAQFISVHCGAIPDTLLESELFGHEKGAFTGAVRRKLGKFEIARGGTIFLDEIGTITPSAQIKLLQILQDGTFQRVGGEETLEADVRVIAASNVDLKQMCENSQFRKDLYYRLNVFSLHLPPLRERKEDIPALVDHFLNKLAKPVEISSMALQMIMAYPWPGNVRELQNTIERAAVICDDSFIEPTHLPLSITGVFDTNQHDVIPTLPANAPIDERLAEIEKNMIVEALRKTGGVQVRATELLGINQRSLWHRIKKHNIDVKSIKSNKM